MGDGDGGIINNIDLEIIPDNYLLEVTIRGGITRKLIITVH